MITSKLPNIGTNIFSFMSQLATQHQAINLGQGFPEFNPDEKLIAAVNQGMQKGLNQYPNMAGLPQLREIISEKINSLYHHHYDAETEITITDGATEALMAAVMAVVHSGDEVIVLEPCYDAYTPSILLAGGIPVYVPLNAPKNSAETFSVDWQRVEQAITAKTKLLILNFPHNPTGITLKTADLDAIEAILARHNILLLADEVYEHIVFNQQDFLSLSTRPAIADRSFIISSFGKTFHITGWKVGYCAAPAKLSQEFRKIHQFMVFTVCSPMQYAIAEYMQDKQTYLSLSSFYENKYTSFFKGLQKTKFKPLKSEGTFFVLADYSAISTKNEFDFACELTQHYKVGGIPVSAFYKNPNSPEANNALIRFCFAKQDKTLTNALKQLMLI